MLFPAWIRNEVNNFNTTFFEIAANSHSYCGVLRQSQTRDPIMHYEKCMIFPTGCLHGTTRHADNTGIEKLDGHF